MNNGNLKMHKWEELMWGYKKPIEMAAPGEKWVLLNKIFDLNEFTR